MMQGDMVHQTLILSVVVEEDLACKSNVHPDIDPVGEN